jgi:hypothetical protein
VPGMETLILANSFIRSIHASLFDRIHRLVDIDLSGNLVNFIESLAFSRFKTLLTLDLSLNNLSMLSNDTFGDLFYLEALNLSSNRLEFLKNGIFRDLGRLEALDLSSNLIVAMGDFPFRSMPRLKFLHLEDNPLQELFHSAVFDTSNLYLKFIYISSVVRIDTMICFEIVKHLHASYVKNVLTVRYFDPINIIIVTDQVRKTHALNYTNEMCFFVGLLVRSQVVMNLIEDSDANEYINGCADYLVSVFKNLNE